MSIPSHDHLTDDELNRYVEGYVDLRGRVEAHIKACSPCRARAAEFVRQDRELNALNYAESSAPGADCPSINHWWRVARGLTSPEDATSKLTHAARCRHCSRALRQTMEDLGAEVEGGDSFLQGLPSSQPDAMRDQARRFAQVGLTQESQTNRRRRAWLIAAAAIVVVVTGTFVLTRSTTGHVNDLLAEAYGERRPSELRFPGAPHGPIRQERGEAQVRLQSIMDAEVRISTELSRHPGDARWLQMSARAASFEWHYDEAITALNKARTTLPEDSSVLADLATAYFERAQAQDDPADYRRALDLFSAAIERDPKAAELRFDRAIILGHLSLRTEAVEEWKRFLNLEPRGPWADEARARLAEIQAKVP